MTTTAHRITAWRLPRPALTCWWYGRESRWSTAFSTVLADGHGLPALADFAIAPARPHRAEEQAAAAFDRWPGLGIVAIPLGGGRCLLGDRSGETALADGVPADLAALAAHLWLTTGRRLGALGPVRTSGCGRTEPELVVVCGPWRLALRRCGTIGPQ
ncbi:hypothetical protein [Amycolatopsis sp. Hca4]|uniref:hypothetical protein n=1 Tax=Amycolatopsis sp. Hca4 TaxID=2742131 RepID=UPI0015919CF1|nr:hypothetical protein [Amycolatopsis sp. Hca4]QKV80137.1 hypothetical protein HUT10_44840 [Amycolatopsis sp. Hca4]